MPLLYQTNKGLSTLFFAFYYFFLRLSPTFFKGDAANTREARVQLVRLHAGDAKTFCPYCRFIANNNPFWWAMRPGFVFAVLINYLIWLVHSFLSLTEYNLLSHKRKPKSSTFLLFVHFFLHCPRLSFSWHDEDLTARVINLACPRIDSGCQSIGIARVGTIIDVFTNARICA